MFGYVMANWETLSEEERRRFRAYYCGLCRALRNRYGNTGRLALSFDMTFLAALLTSLYEPETHQGRGRCVAHPNKPHDYLENPFVDYAADMTIALAYHKAVDDWRDDKKLSGKSQALLLQPRYRRIEALYPRQLQAIHQATEQLADLERENCPDIDPPANATGAMLGEIFVYKKDMWSEALRQTGGALGRFIYLMDAYDDLEKDAKNGSFNALAALRARLDDEAFETRCHELLTQQMGICAEAFGLLPILKDSPEGQLLYNTIYSGVWCKYTLIKARREDKRREAEKRHA